MSDSQDKDLRWTIVDRGTPQEFGIFRTRVQTASHPNFEEAKPFSVIESADFVNVIALTKNDDVILVRQYRHGVESVTAEIPGGLVDAGETHGSAAARELREETGYESEIWVKLGEVQPNPAIMTNRCSTWLALDARRVDTPTPEGTEVLAVEEIPLADIPLRIAEGGIEHALVLAAFTHFLLRTKGSWTRPELA